MTLAGNKPLPGNDGIRWHIMPDQRALATAVSERILGSARNAIRRRGMFRIVLAGGTTPAAVYRRLAGAATDWSGWQIYFGDERCLPAGHSERNSTMASEHWLQRVALPAANIHVIHAESGAEAAAQAYATVVEQARPFDLVLLGMGEDGHTASLFPGQQYTAGELVHAVHDAPKPPPDRVSLGRAALNAAAEVLVMVSGAGKHAAVQRWKRGEDLPVARIHGQAGVDVYIDKVAESGIAA
jgi:6-phosphogluconolactonase